MDPLNATSWRLHHHGLVVSSIEQAATNLTNTLGAQWDGNICEDPRQKVIVAFLTLGNGNPFLELVQPLTADSPVQNFLNQGGGIHHVCYEVDALEEALRHIRKAGALITRRPAPAPAFGGRHVAWILTKERLLVELFSRT